MTKSIQNFQNSPIIPVLSLDNIDESLFVCEALLEGGLTNVELTLRSPNAIKCIEQIALKLPEIYLGAGTITTIEQLIAVKNAGASFAISPGSSPKLLRKAKDIPIDYIPAASTPSEIMTLAEEGYTFQKFFHAKNSGGYAMLKTYASLFPNIKFCPTGGISKEDFIEYLKLPNVICVGGSWMVDSHDMNEKNYEAIKNNAKNIMKTIELNS